MPTMTIDHGYFENHEQVMQDIAKTGYWTTTYVSGLSPGSKGSFCRKLMVDTTAAHIFLCPQKTAEGNRP